MGQFDRRIFSDRRKKPTPAFSRFTLWGRRRTFRRKIDQQKGGYVDHYSALLFPLLISAVVLNVLDAFSTITVLNLGGWEVNPIVRSGIEVYGDKFWVWKFFIVSACVVFLCLHCKFKRAKLIIVSLNIYYIFVVFFNVVQIICR
jgi:NADH:ubiquinone oxidoreductase subunit H